MHRNFVSSALLLSAISLHAGVHAQVVVTDTVYFATSAESSPVNSDASATLGFENSNALAFARFEISKPFDFTQLRLRTIGIANSPGENSTTALTIGVANLDQRYDMTVMLSHYSLSSEFNPTVARSTTPQDITSMAFGVSSLPNQMAGQSPIHLYFVSSVPEASSIASFLMGLSCIVALRRKLFGRAALA